VAAAAVAVETQGLRKSYGKVEALRGIDLAVDAGSVFGLLGPNGAGKTTAVRILTTLLSPDEGSASVAGFDVTREPAKVRESIGLAGQYAAVDENLTGWENLEMVGRLYHLGRRAARARADELLADFDLTEAGGRLVRTYSGGMRAASTSPRRSSPARRSSSSTSPRRGSTSAAASVSGTRWRHSSPAGRPSC
jgi:ABC-type multidrug transport system ATPase subunit